MFQAHQPTPTRTFRVVTFVARMLGREPRPDLDGTKSSLFPVLDRSLPIWISTDAQVWATTEDEADGIAFAIRLCRLLRPGERVAVTNANAVVWEGRGQMPESDDPTFPSRDLVEKIDREFR